MLQLPLRGGQFLALQVARYRNRAARAVHQLVGGDSAADHGKGEHGGHPWPDRLLAALPRAGFLRAVLIRRQRTGLSLQLGLAERVHPACAGAGVAIRGRHRHRGGDRETGQRALDVAAHIGRRLIPVGRVLLHGPEHDRVGPVRQVLVDPRRRDRGLPDVLVGDRHRGVAGERRASGQQLVQQAADRVKVRARVHPLAPGLLGREVLRGPDHLGGLRHRGLGVGDGAGDAEVHHLDLALQVQHDVAGLDVAVHDAGPVAVVQRAEHAVGDLQRPLG